MPLLTRFAACCITLPSCPCPCTPTHAFPDLAGACTWLSSVPPCPHGPTTPRIPSPASQLPPMMYDAAPTRHARDYATRHVSPLPAPPLCRSAALLAPRRTHTTTNIPQPSRPAQALPAPCFPRTYISPPPPTPPPSLPSTHTTLPPSLAPIRSQSPIYTTLHRPSIHHLPLLPPPSARAHRPAPPCFPP